MINRSAFVGLGSGVLAIVLGHLVLGGSLGQLIHIGVFGVFILMLMGALFVSQGFDGVSLGLQMLKKIFKDPAGSQALPELSAEIVEAATRVRKQGLVAADSGAEALKHPLLKRSLKYLTEGFEPGTVQEILDAERERQRQDYDRGLAVIESAAAWAPPMGVITSILGLIQVMSRLSDPVAVGAGMGIALLAMLYGLVFAQVFFTPWAAKLRAMGQGLGREVELVKLGVAAIQQGLPPSFLQEKLSAITGAKAQS